MADQTEPDDRWANMSSDERSDFLDSLDEDERREAVKGLAKRRKQTKPPSSMGAFGSTTSKIGQKADNQMDRSGFEPDVEDVYDPTQEFGGCNCGRDDD